MPARGGAVLARREAFQLAALGTILLRGGWDKFSPVVSTKAGHDPILGCLVGYLVGRLVGRLARRLARLVALGARLAVARVGRLLDARRDGDGLRDGVARGCGCLCRRCRPLADTSRERVASSTSRTRCFG